MNGKECTVHGIGLDPFANTNLDSLGRLAPDGEVELCLYGSEACIRAQPPTDRPFAPLDDTSPLPAPRRDALRALARSSLGPQENLLRDFELLGDRDPRIAGRGTTLAHGDQYLTLAPGEWLEVELAVRAEVGSEPVVLEHEIRRADRVRLLEEHHPLSGGERIVLRYTFRPEDPEGLAGLGCWTTVRAESGERFALDFERARLHVRSEADGEPPPSGARVRDLVIEPASGDPS